MLRACDPQPRSRWTRAPPTQAKPLLDKCVDDTKAEAGCLYYGWTIKEDGSKLFCRETYVDGAAAGHHLSCVAKSGALGEALEKGYIALDNIDLMGTESDIADAKKVPQFDGFGLAPGRSGTRSRTSSRRPSSDRPLRHPAHVYHQGFGQRNRS